MTKSRLYAKCTRPLLERVPARFYLGRQVEAAILDAVTVHGVAPGAPCLCCERDYEDKVANHVRDVTRGRSSEAPAKPKRARLEDAPCYAALLAESRARGLPLLYGTDITDHDRWDLATRHARGERAGFAWCLRESGTQLIQARINDGHLGAETAATDVQGVQRAFSGPLLWYVCRGTAFETIAPVTFEQALEWIRHECHKIKDAKEGVPT